MGQFMALDYRLMSVEKKEILAAISAAFDKIVKVIRELMSESSN